MVRNELTVLSALQVAPSNLQGAHKLKQLLLRCSVVKAVFLSQNKLHFILHELTAFDEQASSRIFLQKAFFL